AGLEGPQHLGERFVDSGREPGGIGGGARMAVDADDLRQCRGLNIDVEDVQVVAAQKREPAAFGELVPEFFERDRAGLVSLSPEQVDHLAEGAGRLVWEAGCYAVDHSPDDALEALRGGRLAVHERLKGVLGITANKKAVRLELVDDPAVRRDLCYESLPVRGGRELLRRLAAAKAGVQIPADRISELAEVVVDLDRVISRRRCLEKGRPAPQAPSREDSADRRGR